MQQPLLLNLWMLSIIAPFALSQVTVVTFFTKMSSLKSLHCLLFVYKALLHKLPTYLTLLYKNISYQTCSQGWLTLEIPRVSNKLGKSAFRLNAPHCWNNLQNSLQLDVLVALCQFKVLIKHLVAEETEVIVFQKCCVMYNISILFDNVLIVMQVKEDPKAT
jgi:hypothetical protein